MTKLTIPAAVFFSILSAQWISFLHPTFILREIAIHLYSDKNGAAGPRRLSRWSCRKGAWLPPIRVGRGHGV